MSVSIKTANEIELMREAGKLLEKVHDELKDFIRPGISTLDIDQYGETHPSDGLYPEFPQL